MGNLEVILPPAKWYPDLDNLPQKWGDKPDRAKYVITVTSYAIGHFTEYPTMQNFGSFALWEYGQCYVSLCHLKNQYVCLYRVVQVKCYNGYHQICEVQPLDNLEHKYFPLNEWISEKKSQHLNISMDYN